MTPGFDPQPVTLEGGHVRLEPLLEVVERRLDLPRRLHPSHHEAGKALDRPPPVHGI